VTRDASTVAVSLKDAPVWKRSLSKLTPTLGVGSKPALFV